MWIVKKITTLTVDVMWRSFLSKSIQIMKGFSMSEKENTQNLVSRRSFLKKTAMVGVGLAAAGSLPACAPKTAGAAEVKWDKEVDVVVVGSGTVAIAAIAAKDAGAESVLILEKGPVFGGTSSLSGGTFWIPVNYVMAANGIEDNREDAIKYLQITTAGQSTDELITNFVDNGNKMLEWLRDKFQYEWLNSGSKGFADYYEVDGFRPAGRGVGIAVDGKKANGGGAWQVFRKTVDDLGIEVMTETAGKKLITNEKGEVTGITAEGINGTLNIKAKKGVILGTGGFDYNKEMANAYLRGPILASNAVTTNTGDGHLMAMELGADLRNMNSCWGLPFYPLNLEKMQGEPDWQIYRGKPGSIIVNKYGERIGNEASAYHVYNRAFWVYDTGKFEWRNTPSYWMCDSTFLEYYFMPGSGYQMGVVPEWIVQADTIEELAEKLGVDVDGLNATLAVFNPNAEEGIDPIWHRGEYQFDINTAGDAKRTDIKNPCLAPIAKGPFYGSPIVPGTCGTNGGPRINTNAQVLNAFGQPIPRLYAVGNLSGSIFGDSYPGGGGCLGAGGVMGMLAGFHAAALESLS